jgi:hypothetical protein
MSIYLELGVAYTIIFCSCLLGIAFGIYNWWKVVSIDTTKKPVDPENCLNKGEHLNTMNVTSQYISAVKNKVILGSPHVSLS